MAQWHPRAATAEHVHFTNKEIKRQSRSSILFGEELRKGKDSWFFMSKSSCSKGGKCSFDHDTAKKGPRQRKSIKKLGYKETIPQKDNMRQRERKVHLGKKIVQRVSTTKEEFVNHDRECDCWHPLHCKYFENDWCQMWKDCPFIHSQKKNRSTITQWKHERKRVWKREGNGCDCQYRKSLAKDFFRKALAIRNFDEHPLESIVKPRANGTIQNAHERHSCSQKQTSIRQEKHQILTSELGETKHSRTNFHLWTWSRQAAEREHLQMHRRMNSDVNKTNFFRCYVLAKVKKTWQALRYIPKTRCTWSTVALQCTWWDSLLWLTMRRRLFDSEAEFLIFRPSNDIVVSDTQAKVYIKELGAYQWTHLVKDAP